MSRRKNQNRNFRTMKVTAPEAASFLNLPERSFYRLVETGVIPKAGEGEYILGEVVESYWRNQKKLPPARIDEALARKRTDANIRLTLAKAKLREAQAALHQQELTEKSMEEWLDKIINAKTHLRAIPTKVGPMLVGQELQVIVIDILPIAKAWGFWDHQTLRSEECLAGSPPMAVSESARMYAPTIYLLFSSILMINASIIA